MFKRTERSQKTWNTVQICQLMEKGKMVFDNPVQRGLVWEKERNSLLIRSILLDKGIPSPSARKTENDIFDVWEGKQRMTAIYEYKKDLYPIDISNSFFSTKIVLKDESEYDFSGKCFSELPEELKEAFNAYTINVEYYENMSDEEVAEAYYLQNNAKAHTPTDHIWALARARKEMYELLSHPLFSVTMTPTALLKMSHRAIIMQAFMMYKSPIKSLQSKDLEPFLIVTEMTKEDQDNMTKIFDRLLKSHEYLLGNWTKTKAKKMLKKTHLLSLVPVTMRSITEKKSDKDFGEWIRYFFGEDSNKTSTSKEYNFASQSSTAKRESVGKRLKALEESYMKYFEVESAKPQKAAVISKKAPRKTSPKKETISTEATKEKTSETNLEETKETTVKIAALTVTDSKNNDKIKETAV